MESSARVSASIDQIIDCGSFESSSALLTEASMLILCPRNHRDQGPTWSKTWEIRLKSLKPIVKKEEEEEDDDDDDATALANLPQLSTTTPLNQQIKIETEGSDTSRKKAGGSPVSSSATCKDTGSKTPNPTISRQPTQHKFENFGNPLSTMALNRQIKNIILRNPGETEKSSDGSIYIYTFPNNYHDRAPYLKIGHTKDLNKRMMSWERKCGYKPKVLVDFRADLYVKVERLVHATLRNERIREPSCPGCGKQHIEWFNVRSSRASSAVAIWTSWTRQEPYNEDGSLKKAWSDQLERVNLSDPHCWYDFVDGKLDEDSSDENDFNSLEYIDFLSSSDDEYL